MFGLGYWQDIENFHCFTLAVMVTNKTFFVLNNRSAAQNHLTEKCCCCCCFWFIVGVDGMLCWKVNQGYSWITLKIPPGSIIRSSDGRPTQCQKIQIARGSSTSPSTGKADKTTASSGRSLSSLATFLSPGESLEHQTRRGTISSAWILIEFFIWWWSF